MKRFRSAAVILVLAVSAAGLQAFHRQAPPDSMSADAVKKPHWIGIDLIRYYEFADAENTLRLSLKNADGRVTGTLTWKRLR